MEVDLRGNDIRQDTGLINHRCAGFITRSFKRQQWHASSCRRHFVAFGDAALRNGRALAKHCDGFQQVQGGFQLGFMRVGNFLAILHQDFPDPQETSVT